MESIFEWLGQPYAWFIIAAVGYIVFSKCTVGRRCRKIARKLFDDYKVIYTKEHEYRRVYDLIGFGHLDFSYYKRITEQLEDAGFSRIQ